MGAGTALPSSTHSRPHSFLQRRKARPARECRMWELSTLIWNQPFQQHFRTRLRTHERVALNMKNIIQNGWGQQFMTGMFTNIVIVTIFQTYSRLVHPYSSRDGGRSNNYHWGIQGILASLDTRDALWWFGEWWRQYLWSYCHRIWAASWKWLENKPHRGGFSNWIRCVKSHSHEKITTSYASCNWLYIIVWHHW